MGMLPKKKIKLLGLLHKQKNTGNLRSTGKD
jgi:hypothetical protein